MLKTEVGSQTIRGDGRGWEPKERIPLQRGKKTAPGWKKKQEIESINKKKRIKEWIRLTVEREEERGKDDKKEEKWQIRSGDDPPGNRRSRFSLEIKEFQWKLLGIDRFDNKIIIGAHILTIKIGLFTFSISLSKHRQ